MNAKNPGRARHRHKSIWRRWLRAACARPCIIRTRAGSLRQRCGGGAAHRGPPREKQRGIPPGVTPRAACRASARKRAGERTACKARARPFCSSHKHRVPAAEPARFIFLLLCTARRRPLQAGPARKHPQSLPACGRRPAAPCRPASSRRPFSAACGASCAS